MLAEVTSYVGSKLRTADMRPVATLSVAWNTVAAPLRCSGRRRAQGRMTPLGKTVAIDRLYSDVHQKMLLSQS